MNMITRKTHGVLDYLVGVLLILAPFIFGFANGGAEQHVPVVLGIATLIYSLCTDYELGALKVLPFRVHLILDGMSGILLAASPWLFQFHERVWLPHLLVGLFELAAVAMTRTDASLHAGHGRAAHL